MPAVSAAEEIEPGHYLGTEIEGKWVEAVPRAHKDDRRS
jgi:hypothetical protein